MRERRVTSEAKRQWLILTIGLLSIGSVLGYYGYKEYLDTSEREQQRLSLQAKTTDELISYQLTAVNTTLSKLSLTIKSDFGESDANLRISKEWLTILSEAMPSLTSIAILDETGKVVQSSYEQIEGRDFSQRDYFITAKKSLDVDTLIIGKPFKTARNFWTIPVARILTGARGEFRGVVTGTLSPEIFSIVLNSVRYADDVMAAIAHNDGTLFLIQPDMEEAQGKNLAVPNSLFSMHKEKGQDTTIASGLVYATGEKMFVAINTVNLNSQNMDNHLVVAVGRNFSGVFKVWREHLYASLAVYVSLVFVGCLGLVVMQKKWISSQKEADIAKGHLKATQEEMQSFFEISPDLLCISDFQGNFRKLNNSWEETLGYSLDTLEKKSLFELIHPDDVRIVTDAMEQLNRGNKKTTFITRFLHFDGTYRFVEWRSVARESQAFSAARDITNIKAKELHLEVIAYHDKLTGLPNRSLFFERLSQSIARARRSKTKIALLYVDLDGFKQVNDLHGHDSGDKVLITIAKRLLGAVRESDTVARMGGDEFLIIIDDISIAKQVIPIAQKILGLAANPIPISHTVSCQVGASIGIALYPDNGKEIDALLLSADKAMYLSKKSGKNTFTFYSEQAQLRDSTSIDILDASHIVGIPKIDEQHRHEALLVAKVVDGISNNDPNVGDYVDELFTYTKFHFATEHNFMIQYGYPRTAAHDAAHYYLLTSLSSFKSDIAKGGDQFLFISLEHWLSEHILTEDKALGLFLQGVIDSGNAEATGDNQSRR